MHQNLFALCTFLIFLRVALAGDGLPELLDHDSMVAENARVRISEAAIFARLREMKAKGAFKDDPTIAAQGIDGVREQETVTDPFGEDSQMNSGVGGAAATTGEELMQTQNLAVSLAATNLAASRSKLCSPSSSAPIIPIYTSRDFVKRVAFPPTRTVKLVMQRSVALHAGLTFNSRFACTILQASPALLASGKGADLYLADSSQPTLRIWNTSNIILLGVNVKLAVHSASPFCDPYIPELAPLRNSTVCPSIHVYRSYGITIARGNIFGRVDIYRSMYVTVDSNKITGPELFETSPGVVRVGKSGSGSQLISSHITISNNELFGVNTPVVLTFGAIGVSVLNNFIHSFVWSAIRCGQNTHFVGDCMLSTIAYNYIYNPPGYSIDYDSTGIYFYTHWVNPGNTVSCNYVIGTYHCMYLDNVSSGIRVTGGVCANTFDGIKVNGGKSNVITGVITYKLVQNTPAWMSCLFRNTFMCLIDPGTFWEKWRKAKYNSAAINKRFPYMSTICSARSINGVSCNPPGRNSVPGYKTGYCSGIPTQNYIDMVMIDAGPRESAYRYSEGLPAVGKLNYARFLSISSARAGLNNIRGGDFGLKRNSQLRALRPGMRSCPKAQVGIRKVPASTYFSGWNINKPAPMNIVISLQEWWVAGYN